MKKSFAMMMNRLTGAPIGAPSKDGEFGVFNPDNLVFLTGNVDYENLRSPEVGAYRPSCEGVIPSFKLAYQFPVTGRAPKSKNWPSTNWGAALLGADVQENVYRTIGSSKKADAFRKREKSELVGSLTPCEHELWPQVGSLFTTSEVKVEAEEGQKAVNVEIPYTRFVNLLKSRLDSLVFHVSGGKDPELQDLMKKFSSFLEILAVDGDNVDEGTIAKWQVLFGQKMASKGIPNPAGFTKALAAVWDAGTEKPEDLAYATVPCTILVHNWGVEDSMSPTESQLAHRVMPVVRSSPLWVFNRPSPLSGDRGFTPEVGSELLQKLFVG